jgi:hypothetical protein
MSFETYILSHILETLLALVQIISPELNYTFTKIWIFGLIFLSLSPTFPQTLASAMEFEISQRSV